MNLYAFVITETSIWIDLPSIHTHRIAASAIMQPEHEESTLIIRLVAPPNIVHATSFYRYINDADDLASQDARDASKLPWKSARMVSNLNTSGTLWEYHLPPHLTGERARIAAEKQLEYITILDLESIYVLLQARHKDHAESTVKCHTDIHSETAAALQNYSLDIDDESGGFCQTLDTWFKEYAPMNRYQKLVKLQPDIDPADIATKLWEGARLIIKRLHTD